MIGDASSAVRISRSCTTDWKEGGRTGTPRRPGEAFTPPPAVPPAPDYGTVPDTVRASSNAAPAEPEAPARITLTPSRSLDSVRIERDGTAIGTLRN